jgi:hypothetical protein
MLLLLLFIYLPYLWRPSQTSVCTAEMSHSPLQRNVSVFQCNSCIQNCSIKLSCVIQSNGILCLFCCLNWLLLLLSQTFSGECQKLCTLILCAGNCWPMKPQNNVKVLCSPAVTDNWNSTALFEGSRLGSLSNIRMKIRMEHWQNKNDRGNTGTWTVNLSHCHCIHHKSYMKCHNLGHQNERPVTNCLSHWTAFQALNSLK